MSEKGNKKTFGTHQEVCHVWMSQSQERGKAGYFKFIGKTLYCWGEPLARIYGDRTILINTNEIVDCRMREKIEKAIPPKYKGRVFNVPSIQPLNHQKNISSFLGDIKSSYKSFWTAREGKASYQHWNSYRIYQLRRYTRHFGLKTPSLRGISLNTPKAHSDLKQYHKKTMNRLWDKAHASNKKRDELLIELSKIEQAWVEGTGDKTYIYDSGWSLGFSCMRLRKNGNEIESSGGTSVPIKEAKILYKAIKAGKPVHGFKIGYYTVTGMNGTLRIGCHEITLAEIDRLAMLLNW